jgi:hypothetical protein
MKAKRVRNVGKTDQRLGQHPVALVVNGRASSVATSGTVFGRPQESAPPSSSTTARSHRRQAVGVEQAGVLLEPTDGGPELGEGDMP